MASFTQQNVLQVHPHCSMQQYCIPYGWLYVSTTICGDCSRCTWQNVYCALGGGTILRMSAGCTWLIDLHNPSFLFFVFILVVLFIHESGIDVFSYYCFFSYFSLPFCQLSCILFTSCASCYILAINCNLTWLHFSFCQSASTVSPSNELSISSSTLYKPRISMWIFIIISVSLWIFSIWWNTILILYFNCLDICSFRSSDILIYNIWFKLFSKYNSWAFSGMVYLDNFYPMYGTYFPISLSVL